MKLFIVFVLCIVLLFSILGYLQSKTATIEEIKGMGLFLGKTVIVEGYTHWKSIGLILATSPIMIDVYAPWKCDEKSIRLIGNVKFTPPHRGEMNNHVRVKGNCVHCYGGDICLDVIWYGLATSEKEYKKERSLL